MFLLCITLSVIAYIFSKLLAYRNLAQASGFTACMVVLLLFSPLLLLAPKWETPFTSLSPILEQSTAFALPALLLTYWIAGSMTTLVFYCIQALQLDLWVNRSKHIHSGLLFHELELVTKYSNFKKIPKLRLSSEAHSPVVTGLFQPTIVLPHYALNWDRATLRMVYLHELGHLQRKDLWLSLAAQLSCVLYWWNPLVWLLKNNLRYQCEFAVDAIIVAKGTDRKSYINALCNVAEEMLQNRPLLGTTLSMAYQASLKKRVASLTNRQGRLHPLTMATVILLSLGSTIAIATFKPIPATLDQVSSAVKLETRFLASPLPTDQ